MGIESEISFRQTHRRNDSQSSDFADARLYNARETRQVE